MFRLLDWQREFLRAVFYGDTRPSKSGLCIARKNGKSTLVVLVALCHLVGPWNRVNWRCVVVSRTGSLASEVALLVQEITVANDLIDRIAVARVR